MRGLLTVREDEKLDIGPPADLYVHDQGGARPDEPGRVCRRLQLLRKWSGKDRNEALIIERLVQLRGDSAFCRHPMLE